MNNGTESNIGKGPSVTLRYSMPPKTSRRRQPTSSKPQKSTDDHVITLFKSLTAQLDGGHYRNALKTCDRIIRLVPHDIDATRTKLYLLLQVERYPEALELLVTSELDLQFERAYCHYRSQDKDRAFALVEELKSRKDDSKMRGLEHLEAQLKYRDTAYQECHALYASLLNTCPSDSEEHDDILNNLAAAQSYIDFINSGYQDAIHETRLDVAKLEAAPPSLPVSLAPPLLPATVSAAVPHRAPRKSRIPKHVALGITPPPDPERWLKKRDRTRDVRKTKKGKKEGMGAGSTQGVIVGTASPQPVITGTSSSGGKKKKRQGR